MENKVVFNTKKVKMSVYHYTSKEWLIVLSKQFSKFGRSLIAFSLAFLARKQRMAIRPKKKLDRLHCRDSIPFGGKILVSQFFKITRLELLNLSGIGDS